MKFLKDKFNKNGKNTCKASIKLIEGVKYGEAIVD